MNRNDFLKSGGVILVCACGTSFLGACKTITGNSDTPELPENKFEVRNGKVVMDLNVIPDLAAEGSSVKFKIPSRELKIIVVRTGKDSFAALRDQCTHMGRELEYDHIQSVFRCVSFGHSKFDNSGLRIKGPAKSNLDRYPVFFNRGILEIKIT